MEFIQLAIALIALYLFLLFLAQPILFAWRVLSAGWLDKLVERFVPEDPNSVDPVKIMDLGELGFHAKFLGVSRLGRSVWKTHPSSGRVGYYYLDLEKAAQRTAAQYDYEYEDDQTDTHTNHPRLKLGWKGFTADSSPWEVLGVAMDASVSQIKTAYRKLITKYHPDRFSNLTKAEIDQLERDSKLINAAYSKLLKS